MLLITSKQVCSIAFCTAFSISFFGAAIHFIAPFVGASWYSFLRAPATIVESSAANGLLALVSTYLIGFLMLACSFYAIQAYQGKVRASHTKWALRLIAGLCLMRGAIVVPAYLLNNDRLTPFDFASSLIWFIAGVSFCYLALNRHK